MFGLSVVYVSLAYVSASHPSHTIYYFYISYQWFFLTFLTRQSPCQAPCNRTTLILYLYQIQSPLKISDNMNALENSCFPLQANCQWYLTMSSS